MKHLVTVLLLMSAVGLFIAGSATEAAVLLVAGLVLEGVFWIRLFRRKEHE